MNMRYDRPGEEYPPVGPRAPASAYACNRPPVLPWDRFGFTAREAEVARCLAVGDSNKEVAGRLSIQVATVRFHVANILKKTRADTRTRAALCLIAAG